jgi:Flp pilus assembly protein TadD
LISLLTTPGLTGQKPPESTSADVLAEFAVTGGAVPGFIEDRACSAGGCHAEFCRTFADMEKAHSFHRPRADAFVEDFSSGYFHELSHNHYQVERQGERLYFRRYQLDEKGERINQLEQEIDWIHGAATLVRTYLYQTALGELYQLPIAWYTETQSWGMAPGFDLPHHLNVERRVRKECQFCHNGISDLPGADTYGEPDVFPKNVTEGIGCQRCHGAGAEHTRLGLLQQAGDPSATEKAVRSSIVNPERLAPKLNDDVCNQCHARTTLMVPGLVRFDRGIFSFTPGEALSDYLVQVEITTDSKLPAGRIGAISQPFRTEHSRCYQASDGALTCAFCHDSHQKIPPQEKPAYYRAVCLRCHEKTDCGFDPATDNYDAEPVSDSDAGTGADSSSGSDDCISCHMPKRPSNVNHFPVTDHLIKKRPERPAVPPFKRVIPVVTDAKTVGLEGDIGELYRAAIVVQAGGGAEAVDYLERMIRVTNPSEATPYLILARGQLQQGRMQALERTTRAVLQQYPDQRLALEWLAIARDSQGDTKGAEQLLRRSLEQLPIRVETLFNLGRILLSAGRPKDALSELQRATELRPNMTVAWYYLGRTHAALDQSEEAVNSYRRALALRPDDARSYLALGRLLLRLGRPDEARRYWRHGIRVARNPEPIAEALHAALGETISNQPPAAQEMPPQ